MYFKGCGSLVHAVSEHVLEEAVDAHGGVVVLVLGLGVQDGLLLGAAQGGLLLATGPGHPAVVELQREGGGHDEHGADDRRGDDAVRPVQNHVRHTLDNLPITIDLLEDALSDAREDAMHERAEDPVHDEQDPGNPRTLR